MFRFFRDDPVETEVVWYPVCVEREFVPHPNVFSSWEWQEENSPGARYPGTVGQGEQVTAARRFPGKPVPPFVPRYRHVCGTPEQWAGGMLLKPNPPVILNASGFPECCGAGQFILPRNWSRHNPQKNTILFPIQVLREMYFDFPGAVTFLRNALPAPSSIFGYPIGAGLDPSVLIGVTRDVTLVYFTGIENTNQWLISIIGANFLVHTKNYSTNQLWEAIATRLYAFLTANLLDWDRTIELAGHSMGGALAQIVAAKIKANHPCSDVRIITYGAPRPGDARLIRYTSHFPQIHFVNTVPNEDVICWSPPSGPGDIAFLETVFPEELTKNWKQFASPTFRHIIYQNVGNIFIRPFTLANEDFGGPAAAAFLADMLAGTFNPGLQHSTAQYLSMINLERNEPAAIW